MALLQLKNLSTSQINLEQLKKITEMVLAEESASLEELSIVLVGSNKIRSLNKKYRGKNKVTDVLSFFYGDFSDSGLSSGGAGEIFICLPEVRKNAKKFNLTFSEELDRILIHGILHILGYDHEEVTSEERKKMEEKENYYFQITKG